MLIVGKAMTSVDTLRGSKLIGPQGKIAREIQIAVLRNPQSRIAAVSNMIIGLRCQRVKRRMENRHTPTWLLWRSMALHSETMTIRMPTTTKLNEA